MKALIIIILMLPFTAMAQDTIQPNTPQWYVLDDVPNSCIGYPVNVTGCISFELPNHVQGGLVHIEGSHSNAATLRIDSSHSRIVADTVGMIGPVMSGQWLNLWVGYWDRYSFEVCGQYMDSVWVNAVTEIQQLPLVTTYRDICQPMTIDKPTQANSFWTVPNFSKTAIIPNSKLKTK